MDKHTRSVFLLVHGAWHTSASWDLLVSFLQTQGYETHAINLPSTNAPIDFRGIQADVDEIESQALQLLSSHGTVVVILHSYAGLPGSQAMGNIAPGISMSNDDGSVKTQSRIHIVYLAAYVPLEGQSNQDVIQSGPQGPLPIHLQFDGQYCITNENAPEIFYDDVPEPLRTRVSTSLALNSAHTSVFITPVSKVGWKSLPSTYIHTRLDRAIPLAAQEHQVKEARNIAPTAFTGQGNAKGFYYLNTGHSPFLSNVNELGGILVEIANC